MDIKKEKYDYYYRYSGVPIITVCYLLTEKGDIGRGISICSREDRFNNIEGKKIAKHNAIRSLKHRSIPLIRRREAIDLLIQVKCPFIKKGELNPVLSWWEKKFLFGKKGMYEYKGGFTFSYPFPDLHDIYRHRGGVPSRYEVKIDGQDYDCVEKEEK